MKVYIFTIPKAGTYFIAELLERLGFNNTGYHVSQKRLLDTKKLDLESNAKTPSKAMVEQNFTKTLREMKDNDLAFGHFPVPLMAWLQPQFRFVCAYRHPRKTLISEFIDFRFRRSDVKWISRDTIPDDREAFATYLVRHGENHAAIFSQMLAVSLLVAEPLCTRYPSEHFHFLNFDHLLADVEVARGLAAALGVNSIDIARVHAETLMAETKTKSSGTEVDRNSLWSDRAEELYVACRFDQYVQRGKELGWKI